MSGDEFSRIFSDSISGQSFAKPVGIADVEWNGCCWSCKTVQSRNPHKAKKIRLISGRNSPDYSAGISDPRADVQKTGQAVLDIYNQRIHKASWDHDDKRLVVLIRNMSRQEFTLFERPITRVVVNGYEWKLNKENNLVGFDGDRHAFTWQPHGSQFTVIEPVPASAMRFRIKKQPLTLEMRHVLNLVRFNSDWIEILDF